MSDTTEERIKKLVSENPVLLFMKGTKEAPQCGFSAATIEILKEIGSPFQTVDVLEDEGVRQGVKAFSNWPTIPQLYVGGKFVGGCDIVTEMHTSGELAPLVKAAAGQTS